jgi:uncharacterized protein (TIGR00299 family) protein
MTAAWFHCFAGIAGDMALGSLLDAGAEPSELQRLLERLPIGGWSLEVEPVLRCGIAATRAVVRAKDDGVVRTFRHITGILEEARLPDRVRDRAMGAFSALAEVEGRLHRRPTAQVHFHEVGGHDTVVDIVGTAAALELLDVETVTSSPVATGIGIVRTAHGILPNPSPAVVRLLAGAPLWGRDLNVELTTPTGAAILAGMASGYGPLPHMVVEATGFGAGSREIDDLPNCTQVVVGTPRQEPSGGGQPLVVLETSVDDATGETLAHAVAALMDAGALDAWLTPVLMKKGRPGHIVSVLADAGLVESLRAILLDETGTFGVRSHEVVRWPVSRQMDEVEVGGLPVRVKVSPGRVKAEQADAARVARRLGMPLREVLSRAEAAWRERSQTPPVERRDAGEPDGQPAPVLDMPYFDRGDGPPESDGA